MCRCALSFSVLTDSILGVERIKILLIKLLLRSAKNIAESLEMHYLTLTEKFNNVAYVGIIRKSEKIIVSYSCLLFCYYHVFATKLSLAKVRKILILQGFTALFV